MGKSKKGFSNGGGKNPNPPRPSIEDVPESCDSSPSEVSQSMEDWSTEDPYKFDPEVDESLENASEVSHEHAFFSNN
jgi:hypothetical protein